MSDVNDAIKDGVPGESQSANGRYRPLAIAAVALVAHLQKIIRRLLRANRLCRRAEIKVVFIKLAFLALCDVGAAVFRRLGGVRAFLQLATSVWRRGAIARHV